MKQSLLTEELKKEMVFELSESYKDYQSGWISLDKIDGICHAYRAICTKEEWREIRKEAQEQCK